MKSLWALFLLVPNLANAFCLGPKIRVDDEYFTSTIVITGTVISQKEMKKLPGDDINGTDYTVRVMRTWRGKPSAIIHVYSEHSSGGFFMESHKIYIVFASRQSSGYYIDNCGNSGLIEQAASTVASLENIRPSPEGLLYGELINCDSNFVRGKVPCSGIAVTVRGTSSSFTTTTDAAGSFQIDVPAGTYSVTLSGNNYQYIKYDLSYKDPSNVTVPGGGSAGLAFEVPEP